MCFCRTGIASIRWIFLFARLNSISGFEKNVKQQGSGDATRIYTQRLAPFKDHLHKKFILFIVETQTAFSRYLMECKSICKCRNYPFSVNSLKYFPTAYIRHRGASVNVPLLINTLFSSHLRL